MNEDGADSGKGTEGASGQHTNRPDSEMRGNEREEEVGEGKQKTGKPRAWGGAGPLVPMYLDGVELAQASAILARHLSEHGLGRVATEAGYGISFSRVRDKNRPDNKGMFVRYPEKLAQSLIMDEKAAERVTRAVGHTQWRMKAWVEGRYRVLDGRERVVVTTHTVMCGGVAMGRTDIQEAEREIEQHLDHQLDNKAVKVRVCTYDGATTGRVFVQLQDGEAAQALCQLMARGPLRVPVGERTLPGHGTALRKAVHLQRETARLPPLKTVVTSPPPSSGGGRHSGPAPNQPDPRASAPRPQEQAQQPARSQWRLPPEASGSEQAGPTPAQDREQTRQIEELKAQVTEAKAAARRAEDELRREREERKKYTETAASRDETARQEAESLRNQLESPAEERGGAA